MGKRKKKNQGFNQGFNGPVRKILLPAPVPDNRPNWPEWERHEVMMSVTMEYAPENLEQEYLAVICPVAKRRIVVSYMGWTCSYNKLMAMDRKFQSSIPGGNVRSVQVIKSNDMCILDCLHYKAERTFYILDLMHWKQLPYYQSEAEFRFHWINQIEEEMDLVTIHSENEYKFKSMPRFRCNPMVLYEALENAPFKVDGILFFHKHNCYQPGSSCNVFWLPPGDIEKVLGWKPPEKVVHVPKKKPNSVSTVASGDAASTSSATSREKIAVPREATSTTTSGEETAPSKAASTTTPSGDATVMAPNDGVSTPTSGEAAGTTIAATAATTSTDTTTVTDSETAATSTTTTAAS